jgi:hypothetical protein
MPTIASGESDRVALHHLVRHANDRARDIVAVEHDLFGCVQLFHVLPGLTGPG